MTGLDSIDIMMLENLQKNGRMSNVALSKIVGISPPPCLRRLRYLENSGVIMGYHAKIDLTAIGKGFDALCVVSMKTGKQTIISEFANKVQNIKGVLSCMSTIGGKEFIVRLVARDYNEFDYLITNEISALKGVCKIKTYIVVKAHKTNDEIPASILNS